MKRISALTSFALLACGIVFAEDSAPVAQVKAAVSKLKEQGNYTWTTKTDMGGGGRFPMRPVTGMTQKDGFVIISQPSSNTVRQAIRKGTNVCVKVEDEWQLTTEMERPAGGGFGRGGMTRMLGRTPLPIDDATNLLARVKDLKAEDGGLYSGAFTEEGATALLTFGGGRRGGQGGPPPPKDPKGSVKFWVKDGALSKYESTVQGTMNFRGEDREFKRTTTVEIKDVGTTKLEIPAEAKKKLSR